MSKFFTFIAGILTGAYIAQSYNVPSVSEICKNTFEKISEYEKNNKSWNKKLKCVINYIIYFRITSQNIKYFIT